MEKCVVFYFYRDIRVYTGVIGDDSCHLRFHALHPHQKEVCGKQSSRRIVEDSEQKWYVFGTVFLFV